MILLYKTNDNRFIELYDLLKEKYDVIFTNDFTQMNNIDVLILPYGIDSGGYLKYTTMLLTTILAKNNIKKIITFVSTTNLREICDKNFITLKTTSDIKKFNDDMECYLLELIKTSSLSLSNKMLQDTKIYINGITKLPISSNSSLIDSDMVINFDNKFIDDKPLLKKLYSKIVLDFTGYNYGCDIYDLDDYNIKFFELKTLAKTYLTKSFAMIAYKALGDLL